MNDPIRTLRIDPDGTVTPMTLPLLDAARQYHDVTCVVTCRVPILPDYITFVGIVDDFGAFASPYNPKGWLLYGRSPIWGTMFFGADRDLPLSDDVIDMITSDIEYWPVDPQVLAIVHDEPLRPEPF